MAAYGDEFCPGLSLEDHGLWPGCTEGGTDFSCGIRFNIKEYPPRTHTISMASDPDNKIKRPHHAKYLIQKISKVFMRSFQDEIFKRNTFS